MNVPFNDALFHFKLNLFLLFILHNFANFQSVDRMIYIRCNLLQYKKRTSNLKPQLDVYGKSGSKGL